MTQRRSRSRSLHRSAIIQSNPIVVIVREIWYFKFVHCNQVIILFFCTVLLFAQVCWWLLSCYPLCSSSPSSSSLLVPSSRADETVVKRPTLRQLQTKLTTPQTISSYRWFLYPPVVNSNNLKHYNSRRILVEHDFWLYSHR